MTEKKKTVTKENSGAGVIMASASFKISIGDYENTTQGLNVEHPDSYSDGQIQSAVDKGLGTLEKINNGLTGFLERHGMPVADTEPGDGGGSDDADDDDDKNPDGLTRAEIEKMKAVDIRKKIKELEGEDAAKDDDGKALQKADSVEKLCEILGLDEEDEDEEEGDEADEDAGDEDDDEDDEDEDDEDDDEDGPDFDSMTRTELRAFNNENELGVKFTKAKKDPALRKEVAVAWAEANNVDDEDEDEDEDNGEAEEARMEELESMKIAALKKIAIKHGIKTKDKKKAELVDEIMEVEFPGDDEDDEDDGEDDDTVEV